MSKAIITFTAELDLDSPLWEEGMSDRDKLLGWLFSARLEPQVAMHKMDFEIDGYIKEENCPNCDGTGDVHGFDGEWRGSCNCGAKK